MALTLKDVIQKQGDSCEAIVDVLEQLIDNGLARGFSKKIGYCYIHVKYDLYCKISDVVIKLLNERYSDFNINFAEYGAYALRVDLRCSATGDYE